MVSFPLIAYFDRYNTPSSQLERFLLYAVPSKAFIPICFILLPRDTVIVFSLQQSLKAYDPIDERESGSDISSKFVQFPNALLPIFISVLGRIMCLSSLQRSNPASTISVIPSGTTTEFLILFGTTRIFVKPESYKMPSLLE